MARNLPNMITILRVLAAPVIAVMLWQPESQLLTLITTVLFILAAASDWLDGWLARRMQITSPFGKMLDPIADKLLVAACILALASGREDGFWFLLPALMILMREFLVAGLREFLADKDVSVPVTLMAKWKTTIQLVAIGTIIAAPLTGYAVKFDAFGLALFWLSALMTVKTGYDYFMAARSHFTS